LSFASMFWPDNGGTMPSENHAFTAYVDPVSPPHQKTEDSARLLVVEAPGTAPGSVLPIPRSVYRHSRNTGVGYI
jgi:hypothetical protein